MSNKTRLLQIRKLVESANKDNLGDALEESFSIASELSSPIIGLEAGYLINSLIQRARQADIGWKLFEKVENPTKPLEDKDAIQISSMVGALHELAYCFERIDLAGAISDGGTSTLVRFYMNTICHYTSALFLLDYVENEKLGIQMGGSVIRVLTPIGLSHLVNPIQIALERTLGSTTLGETIRKIRNNNLVHNNFLPDDISQLMLEADIYKDGQQIVWNMLLIDLFHQVLVLKLKLLAILTDSGKDLKRVAKDYMMKLLGSNYPYTDN